MDDIDRRAELHAIRHERFTIADVRRASGLGPAVFEEILSQRIAFQREDKHPDLSAWEAIYGTAVMRLKLPKPVRAHRLLQMSARELPEEPFVFLRLASKAVLVVDRSGIDERWPMPAEPDLFDPTTLISALAR